MSLRQQIAARLAYLQAELNALAALIELHVSEGETPSLPAPAARRSEAPASPPVEVEAPAAPVEKPAARAAAKPAAAPKRAPKTPDAKPAAPATSGTRKRGPQQWSYAQSAKYRISGPNPFRNGNNRALYDHLQAAYGTSTFTRSELGAAIARLRAEKVMDTVQEEQPIVIEFVRFAGRKGRLSMA